MKAKSKTMMDNDNQDYMFGMKGGLVLYGLQDLVKN
jgi:hypothetical protein